MKDHQEDSLMVAENSEKTNLFLYGWAWYEGDEALDDLVRACKGHVLDVILAEKRASVLRLDNHKACEDRVIGWPDCAFRQGLAFLQKTLEKHDPALRNWRNRSTARPPHAGAT